MVPVEKSRHMHMCQSSTLGACEFSFIQILVKFETVMAPLCSHTLLGMATQRVKILPVLRRKEKKEKNKEMS